MFDESKLTTFVLKLRKNLADTYAVYQVYPQDSFDKNSAEQHAVCLAQGDTRGLRSDSAGHELYTVRATIMEDPDGRRRRLKNTWQKNARDKTKELLGQLEKLLPEVSSRRAGCVNEAQILESACALFRRAVWTPRDVIRIGLSSSKSVLFVVVHLSTLAVESRSEGFSRLFKSVGTPAPSLVHWAASRPTTLIDFAHPEDAPHIQSSMSLAVSLTRQDAHDRPSLVVRLRASTEAQVTGMSRWVRYPVAICITRAQHSEHPIGQASADCTGAIGTSGSGLSSQSPPEAPEEQCANNHERKVLHLLRSRP